jgi:hypothetical protein
MERCKPIRVVCINPATENIADLVLNPSSMSQSLAGGGHRQIKCSTPAPYTNLSLDPNHHAKLGSEEWNTESSDGFDTRSGLLNGIMSA